MRTIAHATMLLVFACAVAVLAPAARAGTPSADDASPVAGGGGAAADSVRVIEPLRLWTQRLPRPPARLIPRRHSMDVEIAEVRQDTVFAPVVDQLRAGRFDAARRALEAVRDTAADPLVRQVAAFDRIEVDFFTGEFTASREAYESFARANVRGYLTNDAIGRAFLIDDNSDEMQQPLRLFARSELFARVGDIDSAIVACETAIARFPNSALCDDLHLQAGDLLLQSDTPDAALAHYRAVADSLAETPLAARAWMRIGNYQLEVEQDVPLAIEAYETVLERFPDDLEAPEARKILEGLRRRT